MYMHVAQTTLSACWDFRLMPDASMAAKSAIPLNSHTIIANLGFRSKIMHKRSFMHRNTRRNKARNHIFVCSMFAATVVSTNIARAQTAGDVLDKMPAEQQASYLAGVIEGLAYTRFLRDKPDETGMQCIYDWYYGSGAEKWDEIEKWFRRHPDKPVGALVHVLTERECGT